MSLLALHHCHISHAYQTGRRAHTANRVVRCEATQFAVAATNHSALNLVDMM